MRSDTRCPGCGARNAPEARVCEWCGRAFLLRDQPRPSRWLWTLAAALCALVAAVVAGLALLSASGLVLRGAAPTATPTAAPTPTEEPLATTAVGSDQEPEPTPQPAEYVRVVNTLGQGISIRREPSTAAPRVAARAENTRLRIVGPDETADGRVWRQVEDAQGNRGWVPADFLAPAAPPAS